MDKELVKKNKIIKQIVLDFNPTNEIEERDKQSFLYFIDHFDNILTRDNLVGHITASAFVVNEDFSKALLLKHNILNGYIYPGGHADGESNLLNVAIREVEEETGLHVVPYSFSPINIGIGGVPGHIKHGKYVSEHLHYDILYLLIAKNKDMEKIRILETENSDVKWVPLDETYNDNVVPFARRINKIIVSKIKNMK